MFRFKIFKYKFDLIKKNGKKLFSNQITMADFENLNLDKAVEIVKSNKSFNEKVKLEKPLNECKLSLECNFSAANLCINDK